MKDPSVPVPIPLTDHFPAPSSAAATGPTGLSTGESDGIFVYDGLRLYFEASATASSVNNMPGRTSMGALWGDWLAEIQTFKAPGQGFLRLYVYPE